MNRVQFMLLVAVWSCGPVPNTPDASMTDSGVIVDAGEKQDSGLVSDGGRMVADSGFQNDSGVLFDAGATQDSGLFFDGGMASDSGLQNDGGTPIDAGTDAGVDAGVFTLLSSAFVSGGAIPNAHACSGTNVSPAMSWNNPPSGSMGFAVVFTDTSINLIHSMLYDISAGTSSLPENIAKVAQPSIPMGSKQTLAYDNSTRGYLGPCPPNTHNYRFTVYALDVSVLPGLTLNSTKAQVQAAIGSHTLGAANLLGTYTP
jgi:Raf kinase inhibitor-like YbhB/YbcL family protein